MPSLSRPAGKKKKETSLSPLLPPAEAAEAAGDLADGELPPPRKACSRMCFLLVLTALRRQVLLCQQAEEVVIYIYIYI